MSWAPLAIQAISAIAPLLSKGGSSGGGSGGTLAPAPAMQQATQPPPNILSLVSQAATPKTALTSIGTPTPPSDTGFEGLLAKLGMNKDKLGQLGMSLMQSGAQQQSGTMQLAPFSPNLGAGPTGPGALMELMKQYGMNSIQ